MDTNPEDANSEACWTRAVAAYARPGMPETCLALQDEHGICVPTLLCLCDLAVCGKRVTREEFAAIDAEVASWRHDVVGRLRAARRAMKAHPLSMDDGWADIYARLKGVELGAEKTLMAVLARRLHERARPLGKTTPAALIADLLPAAPVEMINRIVDLYCH